MRGSVSDPIYVRFSGRTIDNAAIVELRTNKAPYRASFSDSRTSRRRLLAGPGPAAGGSAGRFSALARDVSPLQRQHSVVRRSRHVSPSEPLIVLDDADQPDAVTHREQSPEVPEVRFDRIWERAPVRCRRRSRRRVSSRRRHRRRRDSSESSDSDDGRRPRAREFTALTTVPRHERERDPEHGSVSSRRSATWDHAPPRVRGFPATLTTDQPPVDFVDYEDRVNMPMGPHFTSETDRSLSLIHISEPTRPY